MLAIIRDEAYYFAPQGQTKIMNEGWATYWHSTIMTRHGIIGRRRRDLLRRSLLRHAGQFAQRLNPYKLGVELFRDIEDRWNRGCFGAEYRRLRRLRCQTRLEHGCGQGREKIFEVRRIHNDLTFIDEFLTLDFCRRNNMFSFGYNQDSGYYEIESREFQKIKQQLLFGLTNLGRPIIQVRDGNYKNRGELYLEHQFNGPELKISTAQDTLRNVHRLWNRPVHIETVLDGRVCVMSYDGAEHETNVRDEVIEREETVV